SPRWRRDEAWPERSSRDSFGRERGGPGVAGPPLGRDERVAERLENRALVRRGDGPGQVDQVGVVGWRQTPELAVAEEEAAGQPAALALLQDQPLVPLGR